MFFCVLIWRVEGFQASCRNIISHNGIGTDPSNHCCFAKPVPDAGRADIMRPASVVVEPEESSRNRGTVARLGVKPL